MGFSHVLACMHADGQRLSYCEDCEVIKGRAQKGGFTVSQLQDAFEANTFRALFGDMYNYIAAGTRFDFSRAGAGGNSSAGAPTRNTTSSATCSGTCSHPSGFPMCTVCILWGLLYVHKSSDGYRG